MTGSERGVSARFWRSLRYAKIRTLRLTGSPHTIAIGLTIGAMVAWTPFPGVHVLMALAIGWLLRGSLVAAALGTTLSNPLTIPLILPFTWEIGHALLRRPSVGPVPISEVLRSLEGFHFFALWQPVLEPMLIGALPPAIVTGLCCYIATFLAIRRYRAARRSRLANRG